MYRLDTSRGGGGLPQSVPGGAHAVGGPGTDAVSDLDHLVNAHTSEDEVMVQRRAPARQIDGGARGIE
jgi:hypothetical protein